jgi:hypothetical protein
VKIIAAGLCGFSAVHKKNGLSNNPFCKRFFHVIHSRPRISEINMEITAKTSRM